MITVDLLIEYNSTDLSDMALHCSVPLDMDMDNDDLVCMLFEEQMAFVQQNFPLVQMFLKEARRLDPNGNWQRDYANLDDYFATQLGMNVDVLRDDYEFGTCLCELFHLLNENRGLFNQVYHAAAATKK
jgi:hypothetical protein